jgi:hypothetical protein
VAAAYGGRDGRGDGARPKIVSTMDSLNFLFRSCVYHTQVAVGYWFDAACFAWVLPLLLPRNTHIHTSIVPKAEPGQTMMVGSNHCFSPNPSCRMVGKVCCWLLMPKNGGERKDPKDKEPDQSNIIGGAPGGYTWRAILGLLMGDSLVHVAGQSSEEGVSQVF